MTKILPFIATITLIVFFAFRADSQFVPKTVSLSATPSSPSPGQTVTIKASTPLFDANSAYFQWLVNGVNRAEFSGTGKNVIKLTAGSVGSLSKIAVLVSRNGGSGGQASLEIIVSDLTLVWSSETRVPKWYQGKALPAQNSVITITALPDIIIDGASIDPKNLVYKWSVGSEKNTLSGIGEQSLNIKTSIVPGTPAQAKVTVEDLNKRVKKEGNIFINTYSPEVIVYPFTPLGGIEPRNGTGEFSTQKRGLIDFMAETFFLPNNLRKNLSFNWRVGGERSSGSVQNPNLLTVTTNSSSHGIITLFLTIKNTNDFIPSISKTINLELK